MLIADYRALAELRHQIRRFLAFSEDESRIAGLEPQQHQLLLAVKGLPAGERATIKTVAARLLLKHHSVVELADRLSAEGLLERGAGADKREVLLHITPRGERLLRRLSVSHKAQLAHAGPALLDALAVVVGPARRRRRSA